MNIFDKLQPLSVQIQKKLQESVEASFPKSLRDPIQYFLRTSGKKIRPLLTLLACKVVGGEIDRALPAAVGIELFHDFTLIHDDIMDRDDLRRGKLTIHKKWDEGTAILVGDAMIGMAYTNMLKCESRHNEAISRLFSEALIKVCEGQALDKEFEKRSDVQLEEYLDMISKKTAWLIKMSCQVGAILGGGTNEQVDSLKNFGENLGMGFQIQDDLLDFIADESKLGKKVGSDFRMDKKTYVTLKYQEIVQKKSELLDQYPDQIWKFESLEKLKEALFNLGIVEETRMVVKKYFRLALKYLEKVQSAQEDNPLLEIVQFLSDREF